MSVRTAPPPAAAASRRERHRAILELVRNQPIRTQDELVAALGGLRLEATQATISRDIRDLGLVRVGDADGHRWVAPGDPALAPAAEESGRLPSRLERIVREHVLGIEVVEHTAVVRSRPSTAPLVAAALDQAHLAEVAGTVAGDDTVIAVCRGPRAAALLERRFLSIMEGTR